MKILREYLTLTGVRQVELAAKLDIDQPHLNNLIQGRIEAGPKLIKKISDATTIKVEKLIASAVS